MCEIILKYGIWTEILWIFSNMRWKSTYHFKRYKYNLSNSNSVNGIPNKVHNISLNGHRYYLSSDFYLFFWKLYELFEYLYIFFLISLSCFFIAAML